MLVRFHNGRELGAARVMTRPVTVPGTGYTARVVGVRGLDSLLFEALGVERRGREPTRSERRRGEVETHETAILSEEQFARYLRAVEAARALGLVLTIPIVGEHCSAHRLPDEIRRILNE